jgi:hypothetical protein
MAYGSDVSVFVEDKAGDLGAAGSNPFWLSPDVDIPAHPGEATQGSNDVRIRVHAHEEPIVDELIAAEVYIGQPGFVLSPTTGTKRIDPGNLRFRPANVAGTQPVANTPGSTLTFAWTPSSTASQPDGPGHRCLILRAFPVSVTPPSSAFDVPNEQHEAQRNIEILATTKRMAKPGGKQGAGTPGDPRRHDKDGLWWEDLLTLAVGRRRGKRYVVWAFDPDPSREVVGGLRKGLAAAKARGFSKEPPATVELGAVEQRFEPIDPLKLLRNRSFARQSGLGRGVFQEDLLLAAGSVELGPRSPTHLLLGFDHSNLRAGTAVVLHGAQFDARGRPEGGMTVVAVAPR